MIAIIKGDIIASRKLVNQEIWLSPLKSLLATWGNTPKDWKIDWGDLFQVEIINPEEALRKVFEIKALIKKIEPFKERKKISTIDVRMSIGIGEKTYSGSSPALYNCCIRNRDAGTHVELVKSIKRQ
ncbi:MAG: hypothetical protein JJU02_06975 [Cryomorphaceae bacterium]|nr:hypothetical protein [Cryomorphaceae bacterium]